MVYKLVERCLKIDKQDYVERITDPEIRKFAKNLHFYSSKAYEYVRNVFYKLGTLRTWTSQIASAPGFRKEFFF